MDGGTPNYLVEWAGPVSGSELTTAESFDVPDIPSGSYAVTVTDANGCVANTTIVIDNQDSNVEVSAVANNGACGSSGNIGLTITGGNGPFAIDYNGVATGSANTNGNTFTITNAINGSYNITVTGSDGCSGSTSVIVNNDGATADLTSVSYTHLTLPTKRIV